MGPPSTWQDVFAASWASTHKMPQHPPPLYVHPTWPRGPRGGGEGAFPSVETRGASQAPPIVTGNPGRGVRRPRDRGDREKAPELPQRAAQWPERRGGQWRRVHRHRFILSVGSQESGHSGEGGPRGRGIAKQRQEAVRAGGPQALLTGPPGRRYLLLLLFSLTKSSEPSASSSSSPEAMASVRERTHRVGLCRARGAARDAVLGGRDADHPGTSRDAETRPATTVSVARLFSPGDTRSSSRSRVSCCRTPAPWRRLGLGPWILKPQMVPESPANPQIHSIPDASRQDLWALRVPLREGIRP